MEENQKPGFGKSQWHSASVSRDKGSKSQRGTRRLAAALCKQDMSLE